MFREVHFVRSSQNALLYHSRHPCTCFDTHRLYLLLWPNLSASAQIVEVSQRSPEKVDLPGYILVVLVYRITDH
ncbi:hypothetical protein GYMLUDRAFT_961445 [Collybiopsis luxurians FD-317 M1]|nr:hypothetical protein GYMLUDRAFT_961445 [Collybiopsis luxurians FD-317 M1]